MLAFLTLWFVSRQTTTEAWENSRSGCDRSTPKELCRLLSTLRALRHVHLGCWLGFRSQVSLVPFIPDATEPNDTEVQDDLAAGNRPRHPRALEALREDNFAGCLGDATADG